MRRGVLLAIMLGLLAGCGGGPATVPVSGRVVFKDGSPVPAGVVEFEPTDGGPAARAALGPDGGFTLATDGRPGAIVGEHRVAVLTTRMIDGVSSKGARHKHKGRTVHPKHRQHDTSGLRVTVRADGPNEPLLEVEETEVGK